MIVDYTAVFFVSFAYVALRSWQQLNVVHRKYWWIVPTSLLMATADVFIIANIAQTGWGWIALAYGLGGGLGSIGATYLHHRIAGSEKTHIV